MARFRFPMQRLLDARLQEERRRQRLVAELEGQRRTIEAEISERQSAIRGGKRRLRAMLAGGERVDLRSARFEMNASLSSEGAAREAALRLAGVHERLEAARASLLEATTARRAVELLRDRRYEQWKSAQEKAEARLLDEIGSQTGRTTR